MGNPKIKMNLVVVAAVDPMSAEVFDHDTEKEYDAMDKRLSEVLGVAIKVERDVLPFELRQRTFDLYVFDYGGMLPGCESMVESQYREVVKLAEEHPSSVFLMYSMFSCRWYNEVIALENPELTKQPNVVLKTYDDNWINELRLWLGLEKKEDTK